MPKRTILIVAVAVVMLTFVAVMVASSLTADGGAGGTHTMPNGSSMQREMP